MAGCTELQQPSTPLSPGTQNTLSRISASDPVLPRGPGHHGSAGPALGTSPPGLRSSGHLGGHTLQQQQQALYPSSTSLQRHMGPSHQAQQPQQAQQHVHLGSLTGNAGEC